MFRALKVNNHSKDSPMTYNASSEYNKKIKHYTEELGRKNKLHHTISKYRLLLVVITIISSQQFYSNNQYYLVLFSLFSASVMFLIFICKHVVIEREISLLERLITINNNGVKRTNGHWSTLPDNGSEFIDDEHAFSQDLDVFGNSSIFQRINTAHTCFGRKKLASKLCNPYISPLGIHETQHSVLELATDIEFRQSIESATLNIDCRDIERTIEWFNRTEDAYTIPNIKTIIHTLPIISFIVSCVEITFYHTFFIPVFLYSAQAFYAFINHKRNKALFNAFDNNKNSLKEYADVLKIIEDQNFTTRLLTTLQGSMTKDGRTLPSASLYTLNGILNSAGLRHNKLVHLFVNIILLWDCRCAIRAIEWKIENGASIGVWFDVIGEIEALASLSVLAFENPSWTMPTVDNSMVIDAKSMKHPLIHEAESIGNDFSLGNEKCTAIVSGSNMSGKSTFLRTVATNLLLAYTGAPVNADSFHCGKFDIVTSMRTNDCMNKQISTFYAELLRIKKMIDVAKANKTFFLIDEIFSGTNSRDRLEGAFQVIKELNNYRCLGLVSTHDLGLCELATNHIPTAENYHFREHYIDGNIHFDYKIYTGHSTTSNALFIMQKVGILAC